MTQTPPARSARPDRPDRASHGISNSETTRLPSANIATCSRRAMIAAMSKTSGRTGPAAQTLNADGQISFSEQSPQRGRFASQTARPCSMIR